MGLAVERGIQFRGIIADTCPLGGNAVKEKFPGLCRDAAISHNEIIQIRTALC